MTKKEAVSKIIKLIRDTTSYEDLIQLSDASIKKALEKDSFIEDDAGFVYVLRED